METTPTKRQLTFTPGPWEIDKPFSEEGLFVQAQDTSLVCKVYDDKNAKANASLIASAPAFYAALAALLNGIEMHKTACHCDVGNPCFSDCADAGKDTFIRALEQAKAVIAKMERGE